MAREKKGNRPGDVVLVHVDEAAAGYARLEDVRPHARAGWYECDLLFLSVPPQPATWILEREQIDGTPFTMGGRPVRIEALPPLGQVHRKRVAPSADEPSREVAPPEGAGAKRGDNVVPLVRRKP